jgi:hypothetical protein
MVRSTDPPKPPSPGDTEARLARTIREAAALRDNLRRRKQQTRARLQPLASDTDSDCATTAPD